MAETNQMVDLTGAVVVIAGAEADAIERQAALMLRWEIQRKTGIAWQHAASLPPDDVPAIIVGSRERMPQVPEGAHLPEAVAGAEGYVLAVDVRARTAPTVFAIGNDRRGALFAVGRLLRALDWRQGRVAAPAELCIATAPAYPIRGMQLGYRGANDTIDAWDLSQFAQYVRDLIVFGNNAIELIPAHSPGAAGEEAAPDPLMPLSPWDMTVALSALLDAYDMDVWLWLTLAKGTAEDPQRRRLSLQEREALFAACKRIDHVFVPGGDPGDTPPDILLPYLDELNQVLVRRHPNAKMWTSPQKFRGHDLQRFYQHLHENLPDYLAGIVWGPGCIDTLPETRERTPERYPIRHYPDITHAEVCQFPVPHWDEPWAQAYGRQPIQPRPTQMAHACRFHAPYTPGAVAYSDGSGDDVNKMLWNALLWDPQTEVGEVLRDYGRWFIGPEYAQEVEQGLLLLERNWTLPASDARVMDTLAHWRQMEKRADAKVMGNWRFQQGLIRAYGDAVVHKRVQGELALLQHAYEWLQRAPDIGPEAALARAERIVAKADPRREAPALRRRAHDLGAMLFDSIGMQLSIERFGANDLQRGAQLDLNDGPLTDCAWLQHELPRIRALATPEEKLAAIERIVNWTDPGEGGFYDDLGNHANGMDPHLVREMTWEQDPGFLRSVQDAHWNMGFPHTARASWAHQAQVYISPLKMRYTGLDPQASYVLRATYAGRGRMALQLHLGGTPVGEPVETDGQQAVVREFEVPPQAIADGALEVEWHGAGGGDAQIAEAWLIRK